MPHYFSLENDTLFYYSPGQEKFQVFFVFNRQKGDTLRLDFPDQLPGFTALYRLVIDTVFSVDFDGVALKKYKTRGIDWAGFVGQGYILDRIGIPGWFFPKYLIGIPEGPGEIRCYADAEIDTNFRAYPCDYHLHSKSSEPNRNSTIRIYPNPTSSTLFFEPAEAIECAYLYSLTGQLVASSTSTMLDLGGLLYRCYLVKLCLYSGKGLWKKVVKG